ncbi:MAG: Hpt domain-containing protein [Vicinamibacterales bacterium]
MTSDVLDAGTLQMLRALNQEGEPDVLAEVLELFLEDAPARVAAIEAAAAAGDTRGLERAAHGLKGSAGNIGALGLQAICKTLEACGREGDAGPVPALIADMGAEFGRVRAAALEVLAG